MPTEQQPSSSYHILGCLQRAIQRLDNFTGRRMPNFLTDTTATIPGIPTATLWKVGGLGEVLTAADIAAHKHVSKICEFMIGPKTAAYVSDPAHIKAIYHATDPLAKTTPKNGDKSGIYTYLFGKNHNILAMLNTDPGYKKLREFYDNALMNHGRLSKLTPQMQNAMQEHLKKYDFKEIKDIFAFRKFINRLILTMVAETQLGFVDITEDEKDQLADIVSTVLPEISRLKLIAYLQLEETTAKMMQLAEEKFGLETSKQGFRPSLPTDKVLQESYTLLQTLIRRNREHILKKPEDPKHELFLRQFMHKVDDKEEAHIHFAATVLFAGYESTSTSAAFTCELLADPQHQKILEKLREEIAKQWDGKEPLTKETIDKIKYLDDVVKEGLRIHPPFPDFKDILNRDVMLGNVLLKKGTILFVSPLRTHHRQDATFTPRPGLNPRNPDSSFMTFGTEMERICPGKDFATFEIKFIIATLVSHYNLRLEKLRHPFPLQQVYSLSLGNIKEEDAKMTVTPFSAANEEEHCEHKVRRR